MRITSRDVIRCAVEGLRVCYIPFGVDTLWIPATFWLCDPRPVRSELRMHGEGTGIDTDRFAGGEMLQDAQCPCAFQ